MAGMLQRTTGRQRRRQHHERTLAMCSCAYCISYAIIYCRACCSCCVSVSIACYSRSRSHSLSALPLSLLCVGWPKCTRKCSCSCGGTGASNFGSCASPLQLVRAAPTLTQEHGDKSFQGYKVSGFRSRGPGLGNLIG